MPPLADMIDDRSGENAAAVAAVTDAQCRQARCLVVDRSASAGQRADVGIVAAKIQDVPLLIVSGAVLLQEPRCC